MIAKEDFLNEFRVLSINPDGCLATTILILNSLVESEIGSNTSCLGKAVIHLGVFVAVQP